MRVLLINSNQCKSPLPVMPFGLCSVASATEQAGHQVSVLDLCFSRQASRDLQLELSRFQPDLCGVSVRNLDNAAGYHTDFLLAATKRQVFEPLTAQFRGPTVVGGPPLAINGPEVLQYLGVEYGIRGDGELAFVELLRRLQRGAPLSDAGGLVWRKDDRLLADNPPLLVEDLDALAPTRVSRYLDVGAYRKFASPIQIQTKRGCALGCTYCTYHLMEGKAWRLRQPDRVVAEIERLVDETGSRQVEFTDGVFNMPLEHTKAVLAALARRDLELDLHAMGLNPAAVDEELVDLMVQAGFRSVDVGAESSSEITLAGLGKSYGKDAIRRTARLLRSRGVAVHWFLLVGGPGETTQTLHETLDSIDELADAWDLASACGSTTARSSPSACSRPTGRGATMPSSRRWRTGPRTSVSRPSSA